MKTTHHRARRALEPYDRARLRATPERAAKEEAALRRFLEGLIAGDVTAVEALLAEDVRGLSDGGGEFLAARKPIVGRAKVALAYVKFARGSPAGLRVELRRLNGLPALVGEQPAQENLAPRFVLQCAVDAVGRIATVYTVLATGKLTALAPIG